MPVSGLPSQPHETLNKFRFLCSISPLKITPSLAEEECHICMEPYEENGWELDGTLHTPVALPCSHVMGFQCLARWMLSTNFDNHCSFCRKQIIGSRFSARSPISSRLASSFARLEMLTALHPDGVSVLEKGRLLRHLEISLRQEFGPGTPIDQFMAVWEEMLNKMCTAPAPASALAPVHANEVGQPLPGQGPLREINEGLVIRFSKTSVNLAFFVSNLGLVYVCTRIFMELMGHRDYRLDTFPGTLIFVFSFIVTCDVRAL